MRGRSMPRLLGGGTPILYPDEWRGRSPRNGRAAESAAAARLGKRKRRGGSERSLRYAAAGATLVAANPDSADRGRGVQRDSPAGADAALRSAWLAACRARACFREALHLGVLASRHSSDRVVASESRRGGDEHHGVRWAVDAQGHRVAGIWHRAREFVARRAARISGDGAAAGGGARLRVYYRWTARATLCGEARAGDAGAEDRLPGDGVSHRRGPRQDVQEDLGSFFAAHAICPRGDFVCAADLCAGGCGPTDARSQARGDAAGTRARPRHYGRLVFAGGRGSREISGPVRRQRTARLMPRL